MDGGGDEVRIGHGPKVVTSGEFAGWMSWAGQDAFEDQSGPYFFREHEDGSVRCAFRAAPKHMNGGGFMHGGCMMTFADFCLFAISHPVRAKAGEQGPSVTVTLNGEFAGSAKVGDLVEATGEVVRLGGSLIFLRGLVFTGASPMLSFSGVIKKVKRWPSGAEVTATNPGGLA